MPFVGDYDRDFLERPHSYWPGTATGGTGRGTAFARSGRVAQVVRVPVGAFEDGDPSATGPQEPRLLALRHRTGRHSPGALLVRDGRHHSPPDRLPCAVHVGPRPRSR